MNAKILFLKNTIKDNQCSNTLYKEGTLLSKDKIKSNFDNLSALLGSSNVSNINVLSNNTLETGANMFIFLNSCPSTLIKLYSKTFYGPESRMVPLTLKIMKKIGPDYKKIARKILSETINTFGFKYLQSVKRSETDVELQLNISAVEGIRFVSDYINIFIFIFIFKTNSCCRQSQITLCIYWIKITTSLQLLLYPSVLLVIT